MRRWIFNILCGFSLVLCVITAATPPLANALAKPSASGPPLMVFNSGGFRIYTTSFSEWVLSSLPDRPTVVINTWRHAGLCLMSAATGPGRALAIPYWWPPLLTGLLPAIWLIRRLMRPHRFPDGCCLTCGYDLRASKDRCPECGERFILPPTVADGHR